MTFWLRFEDHYILLISQSVDDSLGGDLCVTGEPTPISSGSILF